MFPTLRKAIQDKRIKCVAALSPVPIFPSLFDCHSLPFDCHFSVSNFLWFALREKKIQSFGVDRNFFPRKLCISLNVS